MSGHLMEGQANIETETPYAQWANNLGTMALAVRMRLAFHEGPRLKSNFIARA
jgi:hypothetical protein